MLPRLIFPKCFLFAVWTGLEPATPCVTGRYSNQLNYHTIRKFAPGLCPIASAKVEYFSLSPKFLQVFFVSAQRFFFIGQHTPAVALRIEALRPTKRAGCPSLSDNLLTLIISRQTTDNYRCRTGIFHPSSHRDGHA